jgi:hypothetical protein
MAWREDTKRINNGEQFLLAGLAVLTHGHSAKFRAYGPRRTAEASSKGAEEKGVG